MSLFAEFELVFFLLESLFLSHLSYERGKVQRRWRRCHSWR